MRRFRLVALGLTLSVSLIGVSAVSAASAAPPALTSTAAASTQKQAAVTKIRSVLTAFYTDAQLAVILDRMAQNAYDGKPVAATFDTLFVTDILTAPQTVSLLTLQNNLKKDLGAGSSVPLDRGRATLIAFAKPTFDKISQTVQQMKKAGKTKAACFAKVYEIVATDLTKANTQRALQSYKNSLTVKQWQSVRTHGAAFVLWSQYGL